MNFVNKVPDLSEEEKKGIIQFTGKLDTLSNYNRRNAIAVCLVNNALLLREVNQLRAEKGLEPYQAYSPNDSRLG